jgi:hypothetical protein
VHTSKSNEPIFSSLASIRRKHTEQETAARAKAKSPLLKNQIRDCRSTHRIEPDSPNLTHTGTNEDQIALRRDEGRSNPATPLRTNRNHLAKQIDAQATQNQRDENREQREHQEPSRARSLPKVSGRRKILGRQDRNPWRQPDQAGEENLLRLSEQRKSGIRPKTHETRMEDSFRLAAGIARGDRKTDLGGTGNQNLRRRSANEKESMLGGEQETAPGRDKAQATKSRPALERALAQNEKRTRETLDLAQNRDEKLAARAPAQENEIPSASTRNRRSCSRTVNEAARRARTKRSRGLHRPPEAKKNSSEGKTKP